MPIIDNIPLELNSEEIVSAIFQGRTTEETWEKKVNAAIERSAPLLKPRAVYNWYPVKQLDDMVEETQWAGRQLESYLRVLRSRRTIQNRRA